MKLMIRELVKILKGEIILGDPKTVAQRAVVDSRAIQPGDLFFALKGERTDGHNFAMAVLGSNAAGVVVSHLNWLNQRKPVSSAVVQVEDVSQALKSLGQYLRREFHGPVVGITGSNGKTTTKQMVTSVMAALGPGLSTQGNLNSQIGLPMMISLLSDQHKWMVLEMGASEPGNISSLCEIAKPKIAVITSVGPAHLKTFGSLQKIAASKWEIMDALPFDGTGIIPWGEPLLEPHIRSFSKKIIYFGEDSSCPVRASRIEVGSQARFKLHLGGESTDVQLPVGGRFNVMNALAAAAVGWVLERPIGEIASALEKFEPPHMRMEQIIHTSGALLINDAYNANPASMIQSARSVVESFPDKSKVFVLGSMLELGEDSERMHFHLGAELAKFPLEQVILFGEEAQKMAEGATAAGAAAKKFETSQSPEEVATKLKKYLRPNTVILFKGSRGMQLEKIIGEI
jgi:UDP-N-acetylmuramoyl-tripeptide--D-alanyl-D-alanine ligase